MQSILKELKRADAAAFAGSEFTIEDFRTLHALMVQPYPTEATPAQLAEATGVTRAAMTSRLDRLVLPVWSPARSTRSIVGAWWSVRPRPVAMPGTGTCIRECPASSTCCGR